MTLKPAPPERTRRVGHITHAAQVRVNQRVEKILARRVALARARRAAQRKSSDIVERLKWGRRGRRGRRAGDGNSPATDGSSAAKPIGR